MLLFKILILQLCINLLSSFQLHHWVGNNMRKSIKGLTKQAGICIAVTGISLSNAPAVLNLGGAVLPQFVQSVHAEVADQGANTGTNTKIKKGGASTLQQGISKTITRGVNLDGSDFSNQRLRGVAFQQSIVRDTNFKGSDLYSASFFE